MKDLIISMESTSDISNEFIKKYDIDVVHMDYFIDDEMFNTKESDVEASGVYEKMKKGAKTSTSQINEANYEEFFRELLKRNIPILHIGFSSGLSGSVGVAKKVADKLNLEFGEKILVVDSLGGCQGQVILGAIAREFSKEAKDIYEVASFVEEEKMKIIHKFSVDNLKYLAAGGRISGAAAIVGNLLSIKPIIKVENTGKLVSFMKVISRKKALKTMINQFKEEVDQNSDFCFISHSNCMEDALFMKEVIESETKFKPVISNIGPVLGCHCGPGTVAMFYIGAKR